VLSKTADCVLVCIDIPIGLSNDDKRRQCDVAARQLLGRRASSVFPAPGRSCLLADDYETACRISFERTGRKLSKQGFALLRKIREVDDLMTPALQRRVREIHPEFSFWSLNGKQPMLQNKKTVPGQARRHKLLQGVLADVDSILAQAPTSGYVMDDALDALVAAWTAGRVVLGKAETLPEQPELDGRGLRMEIVCPLR
jgi:predicted RNase H-like nuclease